MAIAEAPSTGDSHTLAANTWVCRDVPDVEIGQMLEKLIEVSCTLGGIPDSSLQSPFLWDQCFLSEFVSHVADSDHEISNNQKTGCHNQKKNLPEDE
jgi:hypothetical protein